VSRGAADPRDIYTGLNRPVNAQFQHVAPTRGIFTVLYFLTVFTARVIPGVLALSRVCPGGDRGGGVVHMLPMLM